MRNILKVALLVSAIGLSGCDTISAFISGNSIASTAPAVSATVEKSLTIAHLAYNTIGTNLITAANTGILKGANATLAKQLYDKAGDALLVADKADAAANETGVISAVNDATDAIAQASALVTTK